ncbi:MAG: hypothetical protein ACJ776_07160 [Chloroflexota bacterium]
MAILAGLFALGSRFAGKVLGMALGWAGTLLFGRVPSSRQKIILAITFGSVIWLVLLAGIISPDIGAFILVLVPSQNLVPESILRLGMLIGALAVPAVVGGLVLWLSPPERRTGRAAIVTVLRGYPLTAVLAVLLVFLAVLAVWRRVRSAIRGRTDAHVPMMVKEGAYDQVATDIDTALTQAGLDLDPGPAPAVMSTPAKWLAAVAGRDAGDLVPDHMLQLHGSDLDILVYPSDLLISGKPRDVARARAAIASRLVTSAAYMTVTEEGQAIEDRLAALAHSPAGTDGPPPFDAAARNELAAVDGQLAATDVPYDEWEVLYRKRLQVERDLRAHLDVGESVLGSEVPGPSLPSPIAAVAKVRDLVGVSAGTIVDAAADKETQQALDRVAGRRWRLAVAAMSIVVATVRAIVAGRGWTRSAGTGTQSGEPASFPGQDQPRTPRP